MARKKFKLPLDVGFPALCSHIKEIRKTAEDSSSAVSALAQATSDALDEVDAILQEKLDLVSPVSFTIPTTGWKTDSAVSGYTKYYDLAVDGLLASDIVAVDVAPASTDTARAANFTNTETLTGVLRLRAKSVPTAAITAQYHITNTAKYAVKEEA